MSPAPASFLRLRLRLLDHLKKEFIELFLLFRGAIVPHRQVVTHCLLFQFLVVLPDFPADAVHQGRIRGGSGHGRYQLHPQPFQLAGNPVAVTVIETVGLPELAGLIRVQIQQLPEITGPLIRDTLHVTLRTGFRRSHFFRGGPCGRALPRMVKE